MPEAAAGRPSVHAELELPLQEAAQGDARDYATYLHSRPKEGGRRRRHDGGPVRADGCGNGGRAAHPARRQGPRAAHHRRDLPPLPCLRAEDAPPGATEFKCAPPIREGANREALWAALADGTLDFVVTDHSPCVPGLKLRGGRLHARLGRHRVAAARARVRLDRGPAPRPRPRRRRPLDERHPAALLGLPLGRLVPGARADLVAWDPAEDWTVDPHQLAHRHPVTPYAGRQLQGRVHDVWLRGQPVVRGGQISAEPTGRLLLEEP